MTDWTPACVVVCFVRSKENAPITTTGCDQLQARDWLAANHACIRFSGRNYDTGITQMLAQISVVDVNPNFETVFSAYKEILEQQIKRLRAEADRKLKGEKSRHEITSTGIAIGQ